MIKEEENEKDYKFFKVILLLFESFIIGVCIIFFIGVTKVNALDSRFKNDANGSWSIWTDDTAYIGTMNTNYNVDYTTSSRSWLQYRDMNIITEPGKKYNLEFKISIRYYKRSSSQVAGGLTLEIYNGSRLVDMGSLCTTSITQGSLVLWQQYIYDVKCVGFSGSSYYPYVSFQVHSNESQTGTRVEYTMSSWNYYENTSGVDTNSIINNQNQNTETITDNANQNTENIINNNNANTQEIIDNQNQNTEKEIESQKVCTNNETKINYTIEKNLYYLNSNGDEISVGNGGISNYIEIKKDDIITIKKDNSWSGTVRSYCIYNNNKQIISCNIMNGTSFNFTANQDGYLRVSEQMNEPIIIIKGERCKNGNQAINDSMNDINDTINDSSIDDPSGQLGDMHNYFGNNGVISDLLLLPVRMFQSIVNTIDGTCSPFNLGRLLGHDLIMPCINLSSRLGSSLYSVIDVLISGFFILTIRKKFVDIFEHFTSLKTGGNELE